MTVVSMVTQGDVTTVSLTGPVTDEELNALRAQYGEVRSHVVELYKIRPTDVEVNDMRAALEMLGVAKTGTWKEAAEALITQAAE